MRTVRINVQNPNPLDGVSPIDLNDPATIITQNVALGLTEITLGIFAPFGSFDPGEVLGDQTASFWLKHLSVSRPDGLPLSAGSFAGIAGPFLAGIVEVFAPMPLIEFVAQADTHNGDVAEGLCTLIPVDHKITFDTLAEPDAGPFVIQITLEAPPNIRQTCQPPIVTPEFALQGQN